MTPDEDPKGKLRDVLAVIDSSAALLERHLGGNTIADRHLRRIRANVRQANDLVHGWPKE